MCVCWGGGGVGGGGGDKCVVTSNEPNRLPSKGGLQNTPRTSPSDEGVAKEDKL